MENSFSIKSISAVVLTAMLSACGGGSSSDGGSSAGGGTSSGGGTIATNVLPLVEAGGAQTADEQTLVILSGSGSDSDGNITAFSWSQTAGSTVSLVDADSASASFTTPTLTINEQLTFTLTVTDDDGAQASDTVSISVNPVNATPVANAGDSQSVDEQSIVLLAGSGNDSDGSIVAYQWTQTSGVSTTLATTTTANTSFTAPTLTATETLGFALMVTDNEGATAIHSVSVTVNPVNELPSVNAGEDQIVTSETLYQLSGAGQDAEANVTTLQWSQTSGPQLTLHDSHNWQADFISPVVDTPVALTFELQVTDNQSAIATDAVTIVVIDPAKIAGANGGANQTAVTASRVTLSAELSTSASDIISYQWQQLSGTAVTLSQPNAMITEFDAPVMANNSTDEQLIFSLTITDSESTSASALTTVTVVDGSQKVIVDAGNDIIVNSFETIELNGMLAGAVAADSEIRWKTLGLGLSGRHVIENPRQLTTGFLTPSVSKPTTWTLSLDITTSDGDSYSDTLDIVVRPQKMIANLAFTDPALKSCVTQIAQANNWTTVEQFNQLNCANSNIVQVSGLTQLSQLQSIDLSGNRIADFDVAFNQPFAQLSELKLDNNPTFRRFNTIPFYRTFPKLARLGLSGTKISSHIALLFTDAASLTYLNLEGSNEVVCGDVTRLQMLLPEAQLLFAETCQRSGNAIANLSFEDAQLSQCVNDNATTHGWTDVEDMHTLVCESAAITSLNGIEALQGLLRIQLKGNNISDISRLNSLFYLTELDLSDNAITSVSANQPSILFARNLQRLDLSGNPINELNITPLLTLRLSLLNLTGLPPLQCEQLDFLDSVLSAGALKRPVNCVEQSPEGQLNRAILPVNGITSLSTITADNTVYTVSDNLRAIDSNNRLLWQYDLSNAKHQPVVAPDGTLYVRTMQGKLSAFSATGELKWQSALVPNATEMAIADDGTIYFADITRLYALNPDGISLWSANTPINPNAPVVGPDGNIYLANRLSIAAYSADGQLKWRRADGAQGISIDETGTLYFVSGLAAKALLAVNANGTTKWRSELPDGVYHYDPIIGEQIMVDFAAGNSHGYVTVEQASGNVSVNRVGQNSFNWRFKPSLLAANGQRFGSVSIASLDNFFPPKHCLIKQTADGWQDWSDGFCGIGQSPFDNDDFVSEPLAITANGLIYVTGKDGVLYAVYGAAGALANTAWPKSRKNNGNTANVNH